MDEEERKIVEEIQRIEAYLKEKEKKGNDAGGGAGTGNGRETPMRVNTE